MTSSLFEIDDQTDEDFFDKLIEDEVELPQTSNPSSVHESQAVSDNKLLVTDASQNVVDSRSGLKSDVGKNDDGYKGLQVVDENDQHYSDIKSLHQAGGVRFNDVNTLYEFPVDKAVCESNTSLPMRLDDETVNVVNKEGSVSPGAGIREVDWSVFSSQSNVTSNSGIGSYSDFFGAVDGPGGDPFANLDNGSSGAYVNSFEVSGENSVPDEFLVERPGVQNQRTHASLSTHGQNNINNQYSENLYPGWRFDSNTGMWHQLDYHDEISNENLSSHNVSEVTSVSDYQVGTLHVSNFDRVQESSQSFSGISEEVSSSVDDLNHISQSDVIYPENMVFDPQYPGWYYDTTVGEWRSLESYTMSVNKSEILELNQQSQSTYISPVGNNQVSYVDSHNQDNVNCSIGNFPAQATTSCAGKQHHGQNIPMWQPELVSKEEACTFTARSQNMQSYHYEGYSEDKSHQFLVHSSDGCPESMFHQPTIQPSNQWSSDRRPYHPLVTFGFGGKLILMKSDNHFGMVDAYDTQKTSGRVIDILSLSNIVMDRTQISCALDTRGYFAALCQESFPGPLVGGTAGMKDINKWVEEKIVNFDNSYSKECENMKLLFALLKVACQHYGKLRSPFGGDYPLQGKEPAEITLGNLFASLKTNSRVSHGAMTPLIQNWPSEGQVQAAVNEMQNLLISGRKQEALDCAKRGHLWGPAIVLAAQLGDRFYSETVKEMALQQFISGSPLRTLYLLMAGKPNDAFTNSNTNSLVPGDPSRILPSTRVQFGSNPLLDDWVENLSVIMANRTKDDEFSIIHLGDCLWKERSEVIGAHICYLVADINFDSYSDSARLCLVGADHIRCPRTYAHPEAIQRTELYEYAKMLGNAQFTLFPFLPYKFVYAQMLAEVGKLSESMKYCQAISKILKSGRGQEEEMCKQLVSSLEDRIRTHQQVGYTTNLAPVKLVGKLLSVLSNARGSAVPTPPVPSPSNSTFLPKDVGNHLSNVSQFSGGRPPLVPSQPSDKFQHKDVVSQYSPYRVTNSQSTLSMSTLVPQSESVSRPGDADTKLVTHNRTISEPDIGKTPKEESQLHEAPHKTAVSANPSRFGRFGSQILQKTVGLVLRPRSSKQAKLGEKNKFYYDEKLKRWVEEGAEPPVEEVALPPPPTTGSFQNKESDHIECFHENNGPTETSVEKIPGMSPPDPPGPPQFSGRGRVGVRSRYVDTFNKAGGSSSNLFKPPPISTVKSGVSPSPTFFVPPATVPVKAVLDPADGDLNTETPSELLSRTSNETNAPSTPESGQETGFAYVTPLTSLLGSSYPSPHVSITSTSSASAPIQRYPSSDNNMDKNGYSTKLEARRTASWSGSLTDAPGSPNGSSSNHNGSSFSQQHRSSEDLREMDL